VRTVEKETKIIPVVYSSRHMIHTYVDPEAKENWLAHYGLWVSHWKTNFPLLPLAWPYDGYLFHQYDIGRIDNRDIDLNRYNGDNVFDYAQMLYIRRYLQV